MSYCFPDNKRRVRRSALRPPLSTERPLSQRDVLRAQPTGASFTRRHYLVASHCALITVQTWISGPITNSAKVSLTFKPSLLIFQLFPTFFKALKMNH